MNIKTILSRLQKENLLANDGESINLFSDCFSKFGVSLLLCNESHFNEVIDILVDKKIPLQKNNGIYVFRLFAVPTEDIKRIIAHYEEINELDFLRFYPEMMAEAKNIEFILEQIKMYQSKGIKYKDKNGYDINLLFYNNETKNTKSNYLNSVNDCLKQYLFDKTLIDKLVNNDGFLDEDMNMVLELQKVENLIGEEYLLPAENGWKVVINNKEINSFNVVKETIDTITRLNLPINYHDAVILVLFYKTPLSVREVEEIIKSNFIEEV